MNPSLAWNWKSSPHHLLRHSDGESRNCARRKLANSSESSHPSSRKWPKRWTSPKASTTILLKTYRSRKALVERLRREENVEILYGEHLAMEGQTLLTDLDAVADRPEEYLSLIMVKKQ